jgi:hypothetical protein
MWPRRGFLPAPEEFHRARTCRSVAPKLTPLVQTSLVILEIVFKTYFNKSAFLF